MCSTNNQDEQEHVSPIAIIIQPLRWLYFEYSIAALAYVR
jgi:hypothetical protein